MKKMLWCMLCLIVLIGIVINTDSRVFDKNQYIYEVSINTMTWVYGGGRLPGRVYYHVENQSTSYDIKRISWNANSTINGKMLRAPDGWWEDKYNVYQSSWWYQIDGGGPANVSSYTAIIVIHERD